MNVKCRYGPHNYNVKLNWSKNKRINLQISLLPAPFFVSVTWTQMNIRKLQAELFFIPTFESAAAPWILCYSAFTVNTLTGVFIRQSSELRGQLRRYRRQFVNSGTVGVSVGSEKSREVLRKSKRKDLHIVEETQRKLFFNHHIHKRHKHICHS